VNGHDPGRHSKRIARATELLHVCRAEMDRLWEARNIDFYGNVSVGRPKGHITMMEARDSLETAERLIEEVKSLIHHR
jgi:HEPN domain-containing protein